MLIETGAGDWFCLPQSVERVDAHAPAGKEHRWIIAGYKPAHAAELPCVLRSTKSYGRHGGTRHPPHGEECDSQGCRIDREGWIRHDEVSEIPLIDLTADRWSCKEPDIEIVELVMKLAEDHRKSKRGRPRRRGRKR